MVNALEGLNYLCIGDRERERAGAFRQNSEKIRTYVAIYT